MGATYTRQSSFTDGDVISAADSNDEFDQLLATFQATSGHTHDGTPNEGGPITTLLGSSLTFGSGADSDITISFDTSASDGEIKWLHDGDKFQFSDDILILDDEQLIFGSDSNVAISYDETTTDSLKIAATEGAGLAITLMADEGDDAGDEWKLNIADGGTLTLGNDIASAGSYVTHLTLTPNSTVASSTLAVAGNLTVGGSFTLGSGAVLSETELELLDGLTAGTAIASKVVTTDASINTTGQNNLTISGELDAATGDFSSNVDIAGDLTLSAGADGALRFSAASSIKILDNSAASLVIEEADNAYMTFVTTNSSEAIKFDKALDINGAVQIDATFTSGVDGQGYDTKFFGDTSSAFMLWDTSADDLIFSGAAGLVVPDGQLVLGSTAVSSTAAELNIVDGDTSATSTTLADADRVVVNDNGTMVQVALTDFETYFESALDTLSNVTTVGALNSGSITSGFGSIDNGSSAITTTGTITGGVVTADSVSIDGKVITMTGSSGDTFTTTVGTNGATSLVTVDTAAAAAHLQITADGTVDIDSAGVLTLDSGAAINIEPASGSAILLDGTISIDAGVVTGATSITSTAFVGDITGDVTGTVATATQNSITTATGLVSVGALDSGSITSNFGNIDTGSSTITTTGAISGGSLSVNGDVTITSTDAGATDDPSLILYRNSSSPADSDDLGEIIFRGRNDNSQDVEYAKIFAELKDASDGTEDGALKFEVMRAGTSAVALEMRGTGDTIFSTNDVRIDAGINLKFEGATGDAHETTIDVVDPTADRTITLPDASGTVALQNASIDMNGTEIILDADGDTSITADTDDQIDIRIAGADDFQFTANTFTAQSGSTIAAQALTATSGAFTAKSSVDISSSGNAIDFKLSGTTIGNIGVISDRVYLTAEGSHGVYLDASANNFCPSSTTGTDADGTIDLGGSSARWKDAYLSGGIHLGGTGSANKLDDYEEGTFTPAAGDYSGTASFTTAYYTKVGRIVNFAFKITGDGTSDSSQVSVTGFPFAVLAEHAVSLSFDTGTADGEHPNAMVNTAETCFFYVSDGSGFTYTMLGSGFVRVCGTYTTT